MEVDPQPPLSKGRAEPRPWKPVWSCCLGAIACLAVPIVGLLLLGEYNRRSEYRYAQDWMEKQFAEIEDGRSTCLVSPDPRFLADLLDAHPGAEAKVTELQLFMCRATDERLARLAQLPNLHRVYMYEVYGGADTILGYLHGKPSITDVSLSETGISDEGMRAIASLPNLKRLHLDYFCKGDSLEPLRGHPSLEELVLDGVEVSQEGPVRNLVSASRDGYPMRPFSAGD